MPFRSFFLVTILCSLVLCLPAITQAQEKKPSAELKLTVSSETVKIGDTVSLQVDLRNSGAAPFFARDLLLEEQSLSFHIRFQDKMHKYSRIHVSPFQYTKYEAKALDPGKSWTLTVTIPAVAVGVFSLYAEFNGLTDTIVISNVVDFEVKPDGTKDSLAVKLETSYGSMLLDMKPEVSLCTVMNFVSLVQQGFYDGLLFYAVIKDQQRAPVQILAGDPNNIGGPSGPGYTIPFENTMERHKPGSVSMLRAPQHPDTAGSQFMILVTDKREYAPDGFYVVFAEVTGGLDVLGRISVAEVRDPKEGPPMNKPKEDIVLTKASVEIR